MNNKVQLWDKFRDLAYYLPSTLTHGDVNWMSDEPSMKLFIRWFKEYIITDHILYDEELQEYQQLCDAGEVLHGQELDDAIKRAGVPIDDLNIDSFYLLMEKDEICFLKDQIETLSSAEEKLENSLRKQQENELVLQKKLVEEQRGALSDGQALMKLSTHIKSTLENFGQSLQELTSTFLNYKNADTHRFFAQGPLEDFLTQCDTFEQNMKIFIKRQFCGNELLGKPAWERFALLVSENSDEKEDSDNISSNHSTQGGLKIHPKTLWEAEVHRVCALAKFKGLEAATENIQSLQKTLSEQKKISALTLLGVHSQEDCSVLETEIDLLRRHEVSTAARDFVVSKIAAIAEDFTRRKSIRRRYRLNRLQILQDKLSRHVLVTDVVWLLLRREKKLVSLAAQFIDEAATSLVDEHAKHRAVMELHQGIQERYQAYQKASSKGDFLLISSLCRLMRVEQTENIAPILQAIQNLSKLNQDAYGQRQYPNLALEKSLKALQDRLIAGPTKQPVLVPADIHRKIGFVAYSVENLENDINRLEINFSAKQELFKKFPIQRGSELLWAWFLSAPAQLHAALRRAEQAVERKKRDK